MKFDANMDIGAQRTPTMGKKKKKKDGKRKNRNNLIGTNQQNVEQD